MVGAPAPAAVIQVTTVTDEVTTDGDCALREAILAANADTAVDACTAGAGDDTVMLPAGTYTLALPGVDDAGASGDLDVTGNLVLAGAGAPATVIEGNGAVIQERVLHLVGAPTVTVSGVLVRDGQAGVSADGGGILNGAGALTVASSLVEANGARNGGGIASLAGGSLTVLDSTIDGNGSTQCGGGIAATGTVVVRRTTVSGNTAGENAGGIDMSAGNPMGACGLAMTAGGTLTLEDSTVSDNTGNQGGGVRAVGTIRGSTISGNAALVGGGVQVVAGGTLHLVNVTVSDNRATSNGGGVASTGTVTLHNATVTANRADSDASGGGSGGGLFSAPVFGTITLENSIVAGNLAAMASGQDCSGTLDSGGYNLLGSLEACTLAGDPTGNQTDVDPLLDVLADNGGPTATHALLAGSPAVDAGDPTGCTDEMGAVLIADQRGLMRQAGGACDAGAFEQGAGPTTSTTTTTTTSTSTSTPSTSSTTTTSTLPPECAPGDASPCDDGDPCTADGCPAGACVHEPLVAGAAARCPCARDLATTCGAEALPGGIVTRFARACEKVQRAGDVPGPRTRRLLGRAARSHTKAAGLARKAGKRGTVSEGCAARLAVLLDDAAARARAYRATR